MQNKTIQATLVKKKMIASPSVQSYDISVSDIKAAGTRGTLLPFSRFHSIEKSQREADLDCNVIC